MSVVALHIIVGHHRSLLGYRAVHLHVHMYTLLCARMNGGSSRLQDMWLEVWS
jgi:hypothetical protein